MTSATLHVLWVCGAPAVGKSTAAWQLWQDLVEEDVPSAYVDIDQLGMLYPAPEGDEDRHQVKVAALEAVIANYCTFGANVLVVSGVIDPARGADFAQAAEGVATFSFCHLTVGEHVIKRRLHERGWPVEAVEASVAEMQALEQADFVHATIDTTGLVPTETAHALRRLLGPLEPMDGPGSPSAQTAVVQTLPHGLGNGDSVGMPGDVTVVCGPRAVGKSTVSWAMYLGQVAAGARTGYVDLQQVSFMHPYRLDDSDAMTLAAANLAAIGTVFARHGAQALIANGNLEGPDAVRAIRSASAPTHVRIVRLTADESTYHHRVARRRAGDNPARLIGDDLAGAPDTEQNPVVAQALRAQQALMHHHFEDFVVDTSRRDVETLAERITAAR